MKIRTRYILSTLFIYLALAGVSIAIYPLNRNLFMACEALVLFCAVFTFVFFRSFTRPFRILNAGIESIQDQDFSIKFLPVGQPELDRLLEVYNRMIDHLRLERTLTSEKNFLLGKLIDASLSGIVMLNTRGGIDVINPAAARIMKLSGAPQVPLPLESLPAPWGEALAELKVNGSLLVQSGGPERYRCYRAFFRERGVKRSFFFIEELTSELIQAERRGYEKVIRMISHEINNSVGAVNSIIDSSINFIRSEVSSGVTKDFIDALQTARERMENLKHFTGRFSEIVQIPRPEITPCDLRDCIGHLLIYFRADLEAGRIRVETRFPDAGPVILFDNQQLELVLINILKNAMEAISARRSGSRSESTGSDSFSGGGKIRITASDPPVVLAIENDGVPIPAEIIPRLFEPFFTSKKTGQGIGLTLIREILLNHECKFSLHTRKDGITEFQIRFKQDHN